MSKLLGSLRDPSVAAEFRDGLLDWEDGRIAEYEEDLDANIAAAKESEAEMNEAATQVQSSSPGQVDSNPLHSAGKSSAIVPKVHRSHQTNSVNTMASAAHPPAASEALAIYRDGIEDIEHLQHELQVAQLAQSMNA